MHEFERKSSVLMQQAMQGEAIFPRHRRFTGSRLAFGNIELVGLIATGATAQDGLLEGAGKPHRAIVSVLVCALVQHLLVILTRHRLRLALLVQNIFSLQLILAEHDFYHDLVIGRRWSCAAPWRAHLLP